MAHKLGTLVRQIVEPVSGRVMDTQYNKADECIQHLVESEDGARSIWINADQLEAAPASVTEGDAA